MTTGKLVGEPAIKERVKRSGRWRAGLPDTGCLGSDKTERSKQPRFIVLSIVPDNVKELVSPKRKRAKADN